jgi:hypothetical protein
MTKCEFHKFGSSGTVQKFDALCVLPLNIINEKIYVFLWFWFVIVSIITGIQVRGGQHPSPPPPLGRKNKFKKLDKNRQTWGAAGF